MSAYQGPPALLPATPAQGGNCANGPYCACLDGRANGTYCTEGFQSETDSRQPYNTTLDPDRMGIAASEYRFPQAAYFSRPSDRAPAATTGVHAPYRGLNAAQPLDATPPPLFAPMLSLNDGFGEGLDFEAPAASAVTRKSSNDQGIEEFDVEHKTLDDALRYVHGAPKNLCTSISVAEDDWAEVKNEVARLTGSLYHALTSSAGPKSSGSAMEADPYKEQVARANHDIAVRMQTKHQTSIAKALCRILMEKVIAMHEKGVPNFISAVAGKRGSLFKKVEEGMKCSERAGKIVELVRTNKRIAVDILDGKPMDDFVRSPAHYSKAKLSNLTSNRHKSNILNAAKRKAEADADANGTCGSGQGSREAQGGQPASLHSRPRKVARTRQRRANTEAVSGKRSSEDGLRDYPYEGAHSPIRDTWIGEDLPFDQSAVQGLSSAENVLPTQSQPYDRFLGSRHQQTGKSGSAQPKSMLDPPPETSLSVLSGYGPVPETPAETEWNGEPYGSLRSHQLAFDDATAPATYGNGTYVSFPGVQGAQLDDPFAGVQQGTGSTHWEPSEMAEGSYSQRFSALDVNKNTLPASDVSRWFRDSGSAAGRSTQRAADALLFSVSSGHAMEDAPLSSIDPGSVEDGKDTSEEWKDLFDWQQ